jgi:hypothetical protein
MAMSQIDAHCTENHVLVHSRYQFTFLFHQLKLLQSAMSIGRLLAAKSIASSPMGGLSEPLISKTGGRDPSDEETEDGHSSLIGIIIGAVLLETAG